MARPVAPVDICNLALDELKQAPIASITTPKLSSEFICARWYDASRAEALRAHPWKFATLRKILTSDPSAMPPFGYTYAYNLPSDYIRLVTLGDDWLNDLKREFEIEDGQVLLSENISLYLRYVYDITDVKKFDPLFVKYLILKLALNMSNKFSLSPATKRDLKEGYATTETEAKAVNGQDRRPKRIQFSRILTKRRGLPGGIYASKYTVFDT